MRPPLQTDAASSSVSVNVYHVKQCLHCVEHFIYFLIHAMHSARQHTLPTSCYLFVNLYEVVW